MPIRVLIVDDSLMSRMMLEAVVKDTLSDVECVVMNSGDEALASLDFELPVDFSIVDYNMPGINGLDLYQELEGKLTIGKRALLTANIQDAIVERASRLGVLFINKPIQQEVIGEFLTSDQSDG